MELSINKAQKIIDDYIKKTEKGYWNPLALIAAITEEIGEVSREIMNIIGIKPIKTNENLKGLGEELGDLLFSIICLANYYEINLSQNLISSLEKYKNRDKNRWR